MKYVPVSPSEMWELHHGGLGKNFETVGTISLTITWTDGQTCGNGVVINYE